MKGITRTLDRIESKVWASRDAQRRAEGLRVVRLSRWKRRYRLLTPPGASR